MPNGIPPRYVYTGKILTGGMGEVLICQDTNLDREVAIKFIQNVRDQRRLFDEIAALQKIRSKHVVQIFDIFLNEVDRRVGIVQEYISGSDMASYVENRNLHPEEYLKILYQIICGIADIHASNLIHRDIKPNNMKFDQSNIIKIFDFGLARFAGQNDSTVGFAGTPGYAAPELYRAGIVPFTNAIDTYAFGVTAWYLSGTQLPEDLLRRPPIFSSLPSFASLPLNIPPAIAAALDKVLSEDVEERPSALEIRDLIGNYLLFGKHRGLLVAGEDKHILERVNQSVMLNVTNYGFIRIKYDGLYFLADAVNGAIYVNNKLIQQGQSLPKNCVITIGDPSRGAQRLFVTFDISNPEVVL